MDGGQAEEGRAMETGVDRGTFRSAMSRLGAAVSVVTSDGPAGLCGTTVTAVSSVTDTPATLLVCVNRQARANRLIRENGRLCVNVLASGDTATANLFAGMTGVAMQDRFAGRACRTLSTGAPVLPGVLAAFDCSVQEVIEAGTHSIILARVEQVEIGPEGGALIYFQRRYATLRDIGA